MTRIGLIVPSSNVTMEIEVPQMMREAQESDMSFHAARMPMRTVSVAELRSMDASAAACADTLLDARCEALAYACLVAVMVQGAGAHREVEERLSTVASARGQDTPVVSSAGALVETLHRAGAARIAMITPYMPELTGIVIDYFRGEGIDPVSVRSLGVSDNYDVGCIPSSRLRAAVDDVDLAGVNALVLSACVQMPSLQLMRSLQDQVGVPVVTAAAATSGALLHAVGADTSRVPGLAGTAWRTERIAGSGPYA
jgi:maleate isomerase